MNNRLAGKIAYVTGASKGIGKAIAIELFKAGATVILGYNTDKQGAIDIMNHIKSQGGNALVLGGDINVDENIDNIFKGIKNSFGKLDILVNNA
ncbi:MAG: SDR family NAD(P)-dependent oxidoreductase, partial [Sarcina sp.]